MLGARRWQTTLRINLPLVAPAITGGALLVGDRFARPVRAAGDHRHAGADRVPAHAHLRHHRQLSAALGRRRRRLSLVLVVLTVIGLALQRGYLERRSYVTVGGRGVRTKPDFARRLALAASGCSA